MRMFKFLTLGVVLAFGAGTLAEDKANKRVITFTKADLGKVPTGWKADKTGTAEGSVWKVVEDSSSPSGTGYAIAQTAAGPGALFNLCILEDSSYKDVEIIVSFKAMEGKLDQGGGIVWRYQDANNYYVARMNPLEDNFRVYKVENGKRSQQFQNAAVKVPAGEWHQLKIKQIGDRIECFVDGKKYLDVKDDTFQKAGKIGLWTKADAQTRFDEVRVEKR
jgi:hypothetical protein